MTCRRAALVTLLALTAAGTARAGGAILHVDRDAPAGGDGSSWQTPMRHLQDALALAARGGVAEIHVGAGIYRPDEGAGQIADDPGSTFHLVPGVHMLGGFAGHGAPAPELRDPSLHPAVLDGDLLGDDIIGDEFDLREDNAETIVTAVDVGGATLFDGFTVRSGEGRYSPEPRGSGLRCQGAAPLVRRCTFTFNRATGGAISCIDGEIVLEQSTISRNRSGPWTPRISGFYANGCTVTMRECMVEHNGTAAQGEVIWLESSGASFLQTTFLSNSDGVLHCVNGIAAVISGCIFRSNAGWANAVTLATSVTDCLFEGAGLGTGGMAVVDSCHFAESSTGLVAWSGTTEVRRSTFLGNGRGISFYGSSLSAHGCVFAGNSNDDDGGAVHLRGSAFFVNCSFAANHADRGGAVFQHSGSSLFVNCSFGGNHAARAGGIFSWTKEIEIRNCVLWGNTHDHGPGAEAQLQIDGSMSGVIFNCIEGWPADGSTNFAADPRFVDLAAGNLHLLPDSPCIDVGEIAAVPAPLEDDVDGQPRVVDGTGDGVGVIDIGADEYVLLDCNGNGADDVLDLAGGTEGDCNGNWQPDSCDLLDGTSADLDGNGVPDECQDCDGDGVSDPHEVIVDGAVDCNGNFVPDACEVLVDLAGDCNGNGTPDECDIAGGDAFDFNLNGIPDECDPDCNGNGVPDFIELALGSAEDCDANDVPDACEAAQPQVFVSPEFALNGGDRTFSFAAPASGTEVSIHAVAVGMLEPWSRYIEVTLNWGHVGTLFLDNGHPCPEVPDEDTLVLEAATFNNAIAASGRAVVTLDPWPTGGWNACEGNSIQVHVSYHTPTDDDTDTDGLLDTCECPADVSGDGLVGVKDLVQVIHAWGACQGCAADVDHDDLVNVTDLLAVIAAWGECPP